jgi:hypothetical protein
MLSIAVKIHRRMKFCINHALWRHRLQTPGVFLIQKSCDSPHDVIFISELNSGAVLHMVIMRLIMGRLQYYSFGG